MLDEETREIVPEHRAPGGGVEGGMYLDQGVCVGAEGLRTPHQALDAAARVVEGSGTEPPEPPLQMASGGQHDQSSR